MGFQGLQGFYVEFQGFQDEFQRFLVRFARITGNLRNAGFSGISGILGRISGHFSGESRLSSGRGGNTLHLSNRGCLP